jgi:heme iron utilization protein
LTGFDRLLTSLDWQALLSWHVSTRQHARFGPDAPDVPEPSLAERARTLASLGRIGSLSTHSRKFPGFPFGSMMPYAADDLGRAVFFISSMAMHTQNLQNDSRASLLITQPDVSGDPLGAGRVTLLGTVMEAPAAEVRKLYLSRYESAKYWQDYSDFAYYRLQVSGVYFIGGFGVMGWVSADEAFMTAVDRLGFHLRLKSGDRIHGRRVAFLEEVKSSAAARTVLVEMVRQARSSEAV